MFSDIEVTKSSDWRWKGTHSVKHSLNIRFYDDEPKMIAEFAKKAGLSVSAYIRKAVKAQMRVGSTD